MPRCGRTVGAEHRRGDPHQESGAEPAHQSKVKIRQPLGTLYVVPRDAADRKVLENADYAAQILEEANIKKLELIDDQKSLVTVRLKPDAKKLGPRAGTSPESYRRRAATGRAERRPVYRRGGRRDVRARPRGGRGDVRGSGEPGVRVRGRHLHGARHGAHAGVAAGGRSARFQSPGAGPAEDLGLRISDRIVVKYAAPARLAEAIEAHAGYLRNELLAERIERAETLEGVNKSSLAGEEIWVSVQRVVPL